MSESFRQVIGVTVGSNKQRKVRQPIRIKTWEDGKWYVGAMFEIT